MKSNFLLLLVLVLHNLGYGDSMSIDSDESMHVSGCNSIVNVKRLKTFFSIQMAIKTKITNLNEDCQFLIYEHLYVKDLMNLAQATHGFINAVLNVYRLKYSDYKIRMETTKRQWKSNPFLVEKRTKQIDIYELDVFAKIMKYFGNQIRKLVIRNQARCHYVTASEWAEVNRIANEYGSDSLTQFDLGEISKELWPHFRMPFRKVKALRILSTDSVLYSTTDVLTRDCVSSNIDWILLLVCCQWPWSYHK